MEQGREKRKDLRLSWWKKGTAADKRSFSVIFLFMNADKHSEEEDDKHRSSDNRSNDKRSDPERLIGNIDSWSLLIIGDTVTADEQTVGTDTIRSAGKESTQIGMWVDRQVIDLIRKDDADLMDLIRQELREDSDSEGIAGLEFIEVREELSAWQAAVTGKDAVRANAAHRERRAL